MKRHIAIVIGGLLVLPFAAEAAERTANLTVHNAYCDLCPSIVKGTLERVKGVRTVAVGKADRAGDMAAEVIFDDALTTPAALAKATTKAGYPTDIRQ
jgi:periplasmic mercuric ion binding protein